MNSRPLVILGCSKRKKQTSRLIPAIDRYDGPLFQVLRRHARDEPTIRHATFILSAKFGLIPSDFPTPRYNYRLSSSNKSVLQHIVEKQVLEVINQMRPTWVFVSVGAEYWQVLHQPLMREVPAEKLFVASGAIGGRASQLARWLEPADMNDDINLASESVGNASLLGVTVRMSPTQILLKAKDSLAVDRAGASRYETWFVDVEGERVAVKWLVSVLFGKPVASFRTADARRVLSSLGVKSSYASHH